MGPLLKSMYKKLGDFFCITTNSSGILYPKMFVWFFFYVCEKNRQDLEAVANQVDLDGPVCHWQTFQAQKSF